MIQSLTHTFLGVKDGKITFVFTKNESISTDAGVRVGAPSSSVKSSYPSAQQKRAQQGTMAYVVEDAAGNALVFHDGSKLLADGTTRQGGIVTGISVVGASSKDSVYTTDCD